MTAQKPLLETERLTIRAFDIGMAKSVHIVSLDEDNRRFMPDEVFDTPEVAAETLTALIGFYQTLDGPLVYPLFLKDGRHIGHVEAVPLDDGAWEIGYHIAKRYAGRGYATEAVRCFAPAIMRKLNIGSIQGVLVEENTVSRRVLEKCGFTLVFQGDGPYQGAIRPIRRYVLAR